MAEPVKGFRSSLVASTLALLVLLGVLLISNTMQKAREGEGKYEFEEDLCFDINSETEFDNSFVRTAASGVGANMWQYTVPPEGTQHNKISLMSFPVNGTIDGYGVWAFKPEIGDVPDPIAGTQVFFIATNKTFGDVIEDDVTTIDIYIDIPGATFSTLEVSLFHNAPIPDYVLELGTASLGNVTKFKLEVADLLAMNSAGLTKKFYLFFRVPDLEGITPGSAGIFDMQWYCIPEIKTPTLTKLGFYLGLGGIGYIFLGIVVSHEYTFEGIIDRIIKLSKGTSK